MVWQQNETDITSKEGILTTENLYGHILYCPQLHAGSTKGITNTPFI